VPTESPVSGARTRKHATDRTLRSVLQDPSVAASPVENRIAFLQAKNLTHEEVNAALSRAASESGTAPPPNYAPPPTSGPVQPYYGQQQYPPQYPPYAWQPGPQEMPRRDWRDWFIMATVVSGVGYGLYSLGKVSFRISRRRIICTR
jgi:peroxin-14